MKTIIGIDPGLKGGIAILRESKQPQIEPIPLTDNKKEIDIFYLASILESTDAFRDTTEIYLEDVHAIFGASAKSTFNFGYVCGQINTVCCQFASTILVQPKVWQKAVWINKDIVTNPTGRFYKKSKLPITKIDTKKTSYNAVKRIFPNVVIPITPRSKVPHDGVIDSLLIAEFGRRQNK
jgi:hypothetical protein